MAGLTPASPAGGSGQVLLDRQFLQGEAPEGEASELALLQPLLQGYEVLAQQVGQARPWRPAAGVVAVALAGLQALQGPLPDPRRPRRGLSRCE